MGHYLVTGVAGFIASRVAGFLLDDGHTVVGVDNLNDSHDVRLKKWRVEQLRRDGFTFHELDICDRDALRDTVFGGSAGDGDTIDRDTFDAVINLAARAGVRPSVENPYIYADTNLGGTLNLLELCRAHGVEKFVLASTSSVYGATTEMPYRENQDTDRPLSPYAASKKAAEAMCYTYHYLHDIDVTVFRYFTVYGPAGRPDMAPFRFIKWIAEGQPLTVYGDGSQSRDFTYVDDIARGTILGLKEVGYEAVNLGSDTPIVLMDAIRAFEEAIGKGAKIEYEPRHEADVPATWANISKARRLLGWQPEVDFEEGVRRTVDWYLEHREWARDLRTD
ncbi:MAG: GDP-mannose 4,6-dehydratase [Rhodothermales bacterium]